MFTTVERFERPLSEVAEVTLHLLAQVAQHRLVAHDLVGQAGHATVGLELRERGFEQVPGRRASQRPELFCKVK